MPPDIERRTVRRLLAGADVRTLDKGATLTTQGAPVDALYYLVSGVATIEKDGEVIAACGPGDYVGEMSFVSGNPGVGDLRAVKPCASSPLIKGELRAAISTDLRHFAGRWKPASTSTSSAS